MKQYNYKCLVNANNYKRYYKKVKGKWERITNKAGEKVEKEKMVYRSGKSDGGTSSREIVCKTRNASNKYQIGTSGFMVSQSQWLDMKCLNCIEMNGTFYKLPSEKTIEKWRAFPSHVGIAIKASKYITHIKRLKDVKDAWNLLWEKISPLGDRLHCVLFQLPPSFSYKDENLQRIVDMKKYMPKDLRVAFEFRNISWFNKDTYKIFKKLKWCVAGTYIQKKTGTKWMGTMPGGLNLPPRTSNFTYLRIHGARGYKGSLSEDKLRDIRTAIKKQKGRKIFVMFNNTFFDPRSKFCIINGKKVKYAAVCNAVEFTNLITT